MTRNLILIKMLLQKQFMATNLGHLRYFLRIEVSCSSKVLSERKYVLDFL